MSSCAAQLIGDPTSEQLSPPSSVRGDWSASTHTVNLYTGAEAPVKGKHLQIDRSNPSQDGEHSRPALIFGRPAGDRFCPFSQAVSIGSWLASLLVHGRADWRRRQPRGLATASLGEGREHQPDLGHPARAASADIRPRQTGLGFIRYWMSGTPLADAPYAACRDTESFLEVLERDLGRPMRRQRPHHRRRGADPAASLAGSPSAR